MLPDGGEAAAAPQENGKRMRRPSVRLHQPYYEDPAPRKQFNPKKGVSVTAPRKPRTAKFAHSKFSKNDAANGGNNGEEMRHLDFEDDLAIGSWRNFSAANRDIDFKRKRVRSSNSKSRVPPKSRRIGDQEIGDFALSTGGESGEQEQDQDQDQKGVGEEEDLGGIGVSSNLVVEDSNPSSPNHSFDDDAIGNHQLSADNDNVGGNRVERQRGLRDTRHSNGMGRALMAREGDGDNSGVRMWLNDLGLRKYATLFDIHGVDDEVLPLLTLEDLKDMGINEVGVRRKLYSSIQKLDKCFP